MTLVAKLQIPESIQAKIVRVEQIMLAQTDEYHPELGAALKVLLSSGGKRIRPLTILLIGELLNGPDELLLNLATAIELLHTATLVHDDLIDGALLRRGVPTLNSHWSPAATVLTGDFLFSCSAVLAADTKNVEVIRLFSKTLTVIVNGEIDQLFTSPCNVSKDDYYQRIYAKTASLFETAAISSAILSGASQADVDHVREYGYSMGMAFQIVDDILDYVGEQSEIGKEVGGDLRQGLITLPMLYFIESHPNDPTAIRFSNHKCIDDEKEFGRVMKAIIHSDAIEKSLNEAKRFITCAQESLMGFRDCPARDNLLALAANSLKRTM